MMSDNFLHECLSLAKNCKSNIGFGAILVKNGIIIGKGRNRRSTIEDRLLLSHVDYAIHAEQAAIVDALQKGNDVYGADVFVAGIILKGKNKGKISFRTIPEFGCRKCPHSFKRFNIYVNIPKINGNWFRLSPEEAMETGEKFHGKGIWNAFVKGFPLDG